MTQILVNGKQVTVGNPGKIGSEPGYALFSRPMAPKEIKEAIYTKVIDMRDFSDFTVMETKTKLFYG